MIKSSSFYNLLQCLMGIILVFYLSFISLNSHAYDLKEYFPLQVGDTRLFYVTGSENGELWGQLEREPVSMTRTIKGVETFIVGELSGACWNLEYEAMAWDHEGLKYYQGAECEDGAYEVMEPDVPVLMAPRALDLGEKKTWVSQFGDESVTLSMTLEAVEDVTVFSATAFSRTFKDSLRTLWQEEGEETCRTWYARGIGAVKEECTGTENGMILSETSQLFSAKVGDSLIGSPLRVWQGEMFSFYLSRITTRGCDMVMNNVVIAAEGEAAELWWVRFTLNTGVSPVAWTITDFGQGTPPVLDSQFTACPIPDLDFSQALYKINIDNLTLDPQLWMRVPFEDQNFRLRFFFPVEKLSWDLYFID